jgi:hypothetical protein
MTIGRSVTVGGDSLERNNNGEGERSKGQR